MMARYGVLECGSNYKGTMREMCDMCNCIDNEDHRLNYCIRLRLTNLYESIEKIEFNKIYSENIVDIRSVTKSVEKVWNTHTANGSMRTD